MAKHLARIHGTEEDKVNCPFYFKIGACRHSDRCSRLHHRPAFSPTILLKHLYRHPGASAQISTQAIPQTQDNKETDWLEDFLCFFEDMFVELSKFGRIESLHVCDNLGDHMIGHVYCKFSDEEQASDALQVMNGRFYDGRKIEVEFSPVTDFREARCRDFDEETCSRGGYCNFMHIKPIPMCLIRNLEDDCEQDRRQEDNERQNAERDRERRKRDRKRSRRDRDDKKRERSSKRTSRKDRHDDDRSDDDDASRSRSRSRSPTNRGGGRGRNISNRSYSRSRSRSRSPHHDKKAKVDDVLM